MNPIYDEVAGEGTDPAAPYGRKPDGTPYTVSPEERKRRGAALAAARAAKAAGGGKAKAAGGGMSPPPLAAANMPPGKVDQSTADRRYAVASFMNLPIGLLATIGKVWPVVMLDAMTLTVHTDTIAHATAVAADKNKTIASWTDKLTASSPYVPLAIAGLALVAQVAVNHGMMPPNAQLGSMPIDDMKDVFYAKLGVPRPESDPRQAPVTPVPDYPTPDLFSAAPAA